MALRYDTQKIGKTERTPQGGLRVSAFLTRAGVFEYKRADGSIQRELRHPDEVFAEDSLATLNDAVLTDLHPGTRVTAKDYKRLSIGHTRNPKRNDNFVEGVVIVQDEKAVENVDSGHRKELSCGYSCDVVVGAGEYNGEKYDAAQTNIRYNHVALGPENWGRAGKSVALHLDSSGDMVLAEKDDAKMETETIDGIQYKVGSTEHIQALKKARDVATGRADAAEVSLKAETARADKAEGERDAAIKTHNDSNSREVIDTAVTARLALQTKASVVLGKDAKFDGKSDRQIMIDVITKSDPAFKCDDKVADAYLLGRFEGCSAPRQDSRARLIEDALFAKQGKGKKPAPGDKKSPDDVRAERLAEKQNAWKQPLSVSKK